MLGSGDKDCGKNEEKFYKMILLGTNVVIYLYGADLDDTAATTLRNSNLDTWNVIVAEVLGYRFADTTDEKIF